MVYKWGFVEQAPAKDARLSRWEDESRERLSNEPGEAVAMWIFAYQEDLTALAIHEWESAWFENSMD